MTNEDKKETLYQYVKDYYWSTFHCNTATLSNTCRQLALGLGGLAWVAKSPPQNSCNAKFILLFLILFFISDAAQYLFQSYSFHNLAEDYDKKIETGEINEISMLVEKPKMNALTHAFFIAKLILLGLASIFFISLLFND